MNRSTKIKSNILSNLKRHGLYESDVTDEEIYSQMQRAQDLIINETGIIKEIEITLHQNQVEYILSSDQSKRNVAVIKSIKIPDNWVYGFEILTNKEFLYRQRHYTYGISQPVIGTVYDNKLIVYPKPGANYEGNIIKLIVNLSSSTSTINETTDPELPEYFDKAIELYATSQLFAGNLRVQFLNEFNYELTRIKPIPNKMNFIESKSIW
ncbi:MAG: hypothetical protein QXD05_00220 [Candidatus Pacearchaeota archaeon]